MNTTTNNNNTAPETSTMLTDENVFDKMGPVERMVLGTPYPSRQTGTRDNPTTTFYLSDDLAGMGFTPDQIKAMQESLAEADADARLDDTGRFF